MRTALPAPLLRSCLPPAACCLLLFSCARTPEKALRAYAAAVERGKGSKAEALLSSGARPLSAAPTAPKAAGPAVLRARAEGAGGEEVLLRRGEEGWRLEAGVLDFYRNDTPRQALWAFVWAIERRRYEVVWSLSPARFRRETTPSQLGEEMEREREALLRQIELLRAHLGEPIRVTGESAVLFYEKGGAELLYEEGGWRVANLY